jgi:hypothetical protein
MEDHSTLASQDYASAVSDTTFFKGNFRNYVSGVWDVTDSKTGVFQIPLMRYQRYVGISDGAVSRKKPRQNISVNFPTRWSDCGGLPVVYAVRLHHVEERLLAHAVLLLNTQMDITFSF